MKLFAIYSHENKSTAISLEQKKVEQIIRVVQLLWIKKTAKELSP